MPKVIDFDSVKSIVCLRFLGYSSKEIGARMRCDPRTVRNKVRDFIQVAEDAGSLEEGLLKAASDYGIGDLVSGLLEISRARRRYGLEVEDAVTGLNVHGRLVKAGMKGLEEFFIEMEEEAVDREYPLNELAPLMVESMKLKNTTGKTYKELAEQAETLPGKVEDLCARANG